MSDKLEGLDGKKATTCRAVMLSSEKKSTCNFRRQQAQALDRVHPRFRWMNKVGVQLLVLSVGKRILRCQSASRSLSVLNTFGGFGGGPKSPKVSSAHSADKPPYELCKLDFKILKNWRCYCGQLCLPHYSNSNHHHGSLSEADSKMYDPSCF